MAGSDNAVKTKQRVARRGHDSGQTAERLDGRHHALGHSAATHLLDAVRNVSVAPHAKTGKRERRTGEISTEALASEGVVRVEVHTGVEIESLVRYGVGYARWRRDEGRVVPQ